jgi:hypothetical protein
VPEFSAVDINSIEIDADTKAMLRNMGMANIPGLVVKDPNTDFRRRRNDRNDPILSFFFFFLIFC